MAEFLVTLGSWQEDETSVHRILAGIDQLRRHEARASARVSVVNLIVVSHSDADTQAAHEVLQDMGARHPARTIIVQVDDDARDKPQRIDAQAQLQGSILGGHPVWSDSIIMRVAGPVVDHLDSLIEPLRLVDISLVLWYYDTEPVPDDNLLKLADSVIVDTKTIGADFALEAVAKVGERHPIVDLSWLRLKPWRELLASLFEGDVLRPYVSGITRIEIAGKPAARRLLSGWLSSRLGASKDQMLLEDAQHVCVKLWSSVDGHEAEFVVEREEKRVVHSQVIIDGELFFEESIGLKDRPLSASLAEAILHLNPTPVFQESLVSGLELENA